MLTAVLKINTIFMQIVHKDLQDVFIPFLPSRLLESPHVSVTINLSVLVYLHCNQTVLMLKGSYI